MLTTETYTIDGALAELDAHISEYDRERDDTDQSTDQYDALTKRIERLRYFKNGLGWQRDEVGWDGDAPIELGALDAGDEAMMHRDIPDHAGPKERALWFVAASTVDAPYVHDSLEDTFNAVSDCHPGFREWAEAKANALGVPGGEGNGSGPSSPATANSKTSATKPDSDTTSPSGSPTE